MTGILWLPLMQFFLNSPLQLGPLIHWPVLLSPILGPRLMEPLVNVYPGIFYGRTPVHVYLASEPAVFAVGWTHARELG